ncbi:glycogen synthase [Candidatus Microgenomates bacterium]|nr:glycogen synthase [Candidatus Microgenomates bacterium]
MKILFLSAEVGPFVSVGGLSQVMYFLPRALLSLDHEVAIFTPKYGTMTEKAPEGKPWKLTTEVPILNVPVESHIKEGDKEAQYIQCAVKEYRGKMRDPVVHFLENQEYYELRANVFGYADDQIRFALLSRGCLEWLKMQTEPLPDIIHCNDWHTAYFIQLARQDKRYKSLLAKIPILMSVHNFQYQGNIGFRYLSPAEKDDTSREIEPLFSEKLKYQNALLRGILYADGVSTVSPTHAVEVLTPEYGEGLEANLQNVRGKITGILNGLDIREFNPSTEPIIKKQYSKKTVMPARNVNKRDLQKAFSLTENANMFVLFVTGRISRQKGWDLLIEVFPHVLRYARDLQIIVLGDGDEMYKNQIQKLQSEFPDRVGLHLRTDFRLPRKLFAGGDVILMPSKFEPGGIAALEALRYGAIPLVRRTGGLSDIVTDFDTDTGIGNGLSFVENEPWLLFGKIVEAIVLYKQKNMWKKLIQNAMDSDFSWVHAAREYEELYEKLITEKKRATSMTPHPAYKSAAAS